MCVDQDSKYHALMLVLCIQIKFIFVAAVERDLRSFHACILLIIIVSVQYPALLLIFMPPDFIYYYGQGG